MVEIKATKLNQQTMSSSIYRGQPALYSLPPAPPKMQGEHVEENISTFNLPVQLKLVENYGKKKGAASSVLGYGMDVYKVSKVSLFISSVSSCVMYSFIYLTYLRDSGQT